jgi:AraC-like DNA-binding protein
MFARIAANVAKLPKLLRKPQTHWRPRRCKAGGQDASPQIGFHVAQSFDLREMGLLYYVAASSESLGDALRRLERYSTIGNQGVALRVREGEDLAVTFHYVGVARLSDRHQIESFLTLLVRLSRQLTNRRLLPSRVSLCHRRKEGCPELDTFLGCDVVFGADTDEVAFPGTANEMPVVDADPYLNKLLIKYAEEARSHREGGGGTLQVGLENAIAPLLPHGKAHVAEISRRLGMSPRTLTRRLASEGLTFAGILTELRTDLARQYLNEDDLAVSQIAWLLGYQEASAFTHAFKRWTGKTPGEARARKRRLLLPKTRFVRTGGDITASARLSRAGSLSRSGRPILSIARNSFEA